MCFQEGELNKQKTHHFFLSLESACRMNSSLLSPWEPPKTLWIILGRLFYYIRCLQSSACLAVAGTHVAKAETTPSELTPADNAVVNPRQERHCGAVGFQMSYDHVNFMSVWGKKVEILVEYAGLHIHMHSSAKTRANGFSICFSNSLFKKLRELLRNICKHSQRNTLFF